MLKWSKISHTPPRSTPFSSRSVFISLRFHLAPFRNRVEIVTAKVTFSNNFAPAWCERET